MRQVNNIILDIREEILILIIKELRETLNSNLHLLSHPLFKKKTYEETEVQRFVHSLGICGSARN